MNIDESSKKLKECVLRFQEICQNEGFTIDVNHSNEVALTLHYKSDDGRLTTVQRPLLTTPF